MTTAAIAPLSFTITRTADTRTSTADTSTPSSPATAASAAPNGQQQHRQRLMLGIARRHALKAALGCAKCFGYIEDYVIDYCPCIDGNGDDLVSAFVDISEMGDLQMRYQWGIITIATVGTAQRYRNDLAASPLPPATTTPSPNSTRWNITIAQQERIRKMAIALDKALGLSRA